MSHLVRLNDLQSLHKTATRALGSLICKFKALGGLSYSCFNKLYESNVQSILHYGAGVYGYEEYKILNTVQNKASRFILGMNRTCSNVASRGDLGWASLVCKQQLEVIRLWLRLSNVDPSRLLSRIYKYNRTRAITCKLKNWEYNIIDMLKSIDMQFLVNIGVCDVSSMMKDCKERLYARDAEQWYDMLWDDKRQENGNKLRTYRIFKFQLCTENYVYLNIPLYKKKIFSMLRAGSLPLEIEKGRHHNPPVPLNERVCKVCTSGVIEDEIHFIMDCSLYDDLRHEIFTHMNSFIDGFDSSDRLQQFYYIMQCNNYTTINTIFKMFSRRILFY